MKIAILGTGSVGQTFATRFAGLGHQVAIGTRDTQATLAKSEKDRYGTPTISEFIQANPTITLANYADAVEGADLVLNATKGEGSIAALSASGDLSGKTILDVSNPLDFSTGGLPTLIPSLSNTNSLGEEIQKTFPQANVVKTLNTMWAGLMVNPAMIGGGQHVNYISGNNEEAKTQVKGLLAELGWENKNILDLGDITAARATESILPIWLRVWSVTQNGAFNFTIVQ
jgi:8-hydroxy-5-deazaflavin:NADPH oxidoreductase